MKKTLRNIIAGIVVGGALIGGCDKGKVSYRPVGVEKVVDYDEGKPSSYINLEDYLIKDKKDNVEIVYSSERLDRFKRALGDERYEALNFEQREEVERIFSGKNSKSIFDQELICQSYENPDKIKEIVYKKFGEDKWEGLTSKDLKDFENKIPWIIENTKLSEGDLALCYILDSFIDDVAMKYVAELMLGKH